MQFDQIARATVAAQGAKSESDLIEVLLRSEKLKGSFRDPTGILKKVEHLVFLAAQGSLGTRFLLRGLSGAHLALLDPPANQTTASPNKAAPSNKQANNTDPEATPIAPSWSPDPNVGLLR